MAFPLAIKEIAVTCYSEEKTVKKQRNYIYLVYLAAFLLVIGIFYREKLFGKESTSEERSNNPKPTETVIKDLTDDAILAETKDWKTYISEKQGYKIKYPPDSVMIYKEFESGDIVFTYSKYKDNKSEFPLSSLQILYRTSNQNDPLDALTGETPISNGKRMIGNFENVKINNAYGIHTIAGFTSQNNYYLTDKEQKGDVLRVDASSDVGDDIELLRKMIMTFEFVR